MKSPLAIFGVLAVILGLIIANLILFGRAEKEPELPPAFLGDFETSFRERVISLPGSGADQFRHLLDGGEVTASLGQGGIEGLVLGAGGFGPVAKAFARVTIFEEIDTTTDQAGVFRLMELDPRTFDVRISAPGWAPALVSDVRVVAGSLTMIQVTLSKAQSSFVEVHSETGDAGDTLVEGATVRLFPGGEFAWTFIGSRELENSAITALTGIDGRAHFDQVRPGSYYAIVSSPEHMAWRGNLLFDKADEVVRVDLDSGGVIGGRVTDSRGGPGIGSVLIGPVERVKHSGFYYGSNRVPLDEQGNFRFSGVPEGEHHLAAVLEGGEVATTVEAIHVLAGESGHVELSASPTCSLHGRVTDAHRSPLPNATVSLVGSAGLHPANTHFPGLRGPLRSELGRTATTDAEGRYVLEGVRTASGVVKVRAEKEGYADKVAYPDVLPWNDQALDFMLGARDSTIAGRVLASFESGLGGIAIVAKMENGPDEGASFVRTTKDDGSFEIAVPSTGSLMVIAGARHFSPPSKVEPTIIKGVANGSRSIEFTLKPKLFLEVRAVDEEGEAIDSLEISLFDDVVQRFQPAQIENNYEGSYKVAIDPERHLFATLCSAGFEPFEIWNLENSLENTIEVTMKRTGEDLAIRVVDAEGTPVPSATVSLEWFGERGAYPVGSTITPSVKTDSAGEGILRAVPKNAPRDFLIAPNAQMAPPIVRISSQKLVQEGATLVLSLPKSNRVEMTFLTPGGEPSQGTCLILSEQGAPITPRAYSSLKSTMPKGFSDATRLDQGRLELFLEPGNYTLNHRSPSALLGDSRQFDFTVGEGDSNVFSFQVDG